MGEVSKLELARRGICPYCGKGPYIIISTHVSRIHELDRVAFRNDIGAYLAESLTDPDWHEARAEISRTRYAKRKVGMASGGKPRVNSAVRWEADNLKRVAKGRRTRRTKVEAKADRWIALYEGGVTVRTIAANENVTPSSVRQFLKSHGITLPHGREEPDAPPLPPRPKQPSWYCNLEGCGLVGSRRGMCNKHYRRHMLQISAPCSVDGCDNGSHSRGVCQRHYHKLFR